MLLCPSFILSIWSIHVTQGTHSLAILYFNGKLQLLYPTTLTANCDYDEFTCNNGECKPQSYVCDNYDDCGDDSDEEGCGM